MIALKHFVMIENKRVLQEAEKQREATLFEGLNRVITYLTNHTKASRHEDDVAVSLLALPSFICGHRRLTSSLLVSFRAAVCLFVVVL
jgi:hypothetical protein